MPTDAADDWDATEEARKDAARARIDELAPGAKVDISLCCDLCGERYATVGTRIGPKAMSNVEALEAYANMVEADHAEKAKADL